MLLKRRNDASQAGADPSRPAPRLDRTGEGGRLECHLSGDWVTSSVARMDAAMRDLEGEAAAGRLTIDLSGISRMDTAGAWLVERVIAAHRDRGAEVTLTGATPGVETLIEAVRQAREKAVPPPAGRRGSYLGNMFEAVGRGMHGAWKDFIYAMYMLGATIRGAQMKLGRGHAVNPAAIFSQIDRMGVGAIPVIVLMSFIVGAIVAQQGAFQLRFFGAEIFVVDLVAILVLRELGVLMTAIMVAGRSGSAITAEIGSMKMREEVDALTVIGLNPIGVLVFPRLVALVIALPCLTVIANFSALAGAMSVAWVYSGIAPEAFIDRMREGIALTTIFAGLIKAPFMALIIGIIASVEGMKVGGSAESLGRQVTTSVVKAIFVVIILDGLFAMFYAAIDF